MDIKMQEFLQSKTFKKIIYTLGVFVLLLVVFRAGMLVGYRKASFSFGTGDNYYKIFAAPENRFGPTGFMGSMMRDDFPSAHGAVGKIIQITLPKLIIQGEDGVEKIVIVGNDTVIRQSRGSLEPKNLNVNDFVVVVGAPANDGYIQAKLIRLVPPPPPLPTLSGTSSINKQ